MKIINKLNEWFKRDAKYINARGVIGDISTGNSMNFSEAIWLNIIEALTDICNDVEFYKKNADKSMLFSEFKAFFNTYGGQTLSRYYSKGVVVIGYVKNVGFKLLNENEYHNEISKTNVVTVTAVAENISTYVIVSDVYREHGVSHKSIVKSYLTYIDNLLNSSNTISARLGSVVFASPKNEEKLNTTILTREQAQAIEQEISEGYGSLRNQKQLALFRQPMDFTTINLSTADQRVSEKLKMAVSVIADRIKVPANQIAVIDSIGAKAFANGSEMLTGDFAKYQSFERLLQKTFINFGNQIGLNLDYNIYNKPKILTTDNNLM